MEPGSHVLDDAAETAKGKVVNQWLTGTAT